MMPAFDLFFRVRSLLRRRSLNSELNAELDLHLNLETEKLIRSGLSRDEAMRRARLAFGFPELIKDECHEARGIRWMEELGRDIRFGMRLLWTNPGFAAVAILSLALGIGANTAMFQLLDAIRLRNLPVPSPQQLYTLHITGDGRSGNFTSRYSDLSCAQWQQIERRQQAFSRIAVWSPRRFNLADGGETHPAEGMLVSGGFFNMLGVPAWRGRVLDAQDGANGCSAALISHSFWQRQFGSNPEVIGSGLHVDGHPFTIVGITPPHFFGVEVGRSFDIAIPLCAEERLAGADSQLTAGRDNYWLSAIGRIRDGWTAAQANAHLRAISPAVFGATVPVRFASEEDRKQYTSLQIKAIPAGNGLSWMRVDYEKPLWLLLGSAALVLLIACGNLANLLLARASARTQEIAVRLALGASRGRLMRQLLTESLVLAIGGATLGLLVASVGSHALVGFLVTADDPVALDTRLDLRVLLFSIALGLVTCLLFGLAPALRAAAPGTTRSVAGSRGRSLFRNALVAIQVALCVVLVAGAMLFGRSIYNLLTTNLGFNANNVLITTVDTRRLGFGEERQKALFGELLERLRATPGVSNAAQSNVVPMSGWESNTVFALAKGQKASARISMVSPGYFRTLRIPLLAGRDFAPGDTGGADAVVVVNEAFVRKLLAGANPIGRVFPSPFDPKKSCRVVGVVANTKYRMLREEPGPIAFFSTTQILFTSNYARYVVRSTSRAADAMKSIRETIAAISPAIDIEFMPLDTEIRESVVRERLLAALGGGFGFLAAVLAAVGLYGLLSYSVETRRNEIGIRMALGAERRAVIRLVVGEAGWLLFAGIGAGLVLTLALTRAVDSLLYGLKPNDPLALGGAIIALLGVGLLSAYAPARRAASLDPLTALRQE